VSAIVPAADGLELEIALVVVALGSETVPGLVTVPVVRAAVIVLGAQEAVIDPADPVMATVLADLVVLVMGTVLDGLAVVIVLAAPVTEIVPVAQAAPAMVIDPVDPATDPVVLVIALALPVIVPTVPGGGIGTTATETGTTVTGTGIIGVTAGGITRSPGVLPPTVWGA